MHTFIELSLFRLFAGICALPFAHKQPLPWSLLALSARRVYCSHDLGKLARRHRASALLSYTFTSSSKRLCFVSMVLEASLATAVRGLSDRARAGDSFATGAPCHNLHLGWLFLTASAHIRRLLAIWGHDTHVDLLLLPGRRVLVLWANI